MRIDARSVARTHAVAKIRLLGRSLRRPSRTLFSRRPSPEEVENLIDATNNHFPLIDPRSYNRRSQPNPEARHIAIIGGGITGLSTAYLISRDIPHAKITILERSNRLGGWLESERVQVNGGDVLFEWGPRSLRPDTAGAGAFTGGLLWKVFKDPSPVIAVPKTAPASQNRFLYYNERLVKMPGPTTSLFKAVIDSLYKLLYEPVFKGLIPSLLSEWSKPRRSDSVRDESVGQFVRRRFGSTIADNLTSALFHGIYAGNIDNLSARTLLPTAWYLETRDQDSDSGITTELVDLFFKDDYLLNYRMQRAHSLDALHPVGNIEDFDFSAPENSKSFYAVLKNSSIYTFADGLQQLSDAIISKLSKNPNITFSTSTDVTSLIYKADDRCFTVHSSTSISTTLDTSKSLSAKFDYAIATIRPSALCDIVAGRPDGISVPEKARQALERVSRAVNVMVVNLYYTSPNLLSPSLEGFGYLIPASVGVEENPERGLGVIFSSNVSGIRGPNALRRDFLPTAEELEALREDLEHKYESDYERKQLISMMRRYKHRIENNPDHVDKDIDVPGVQWGATVLKNIEHRLKFHEGELQYHIRQVKQQEAQAREREAQPDFDPDENYEESRQGQDTATGTKLTVMLGGHWWDGWAESDLPTEAEGIEKAKSLLARHLKVSEEPEVAKARLQRNCIPQYPVGYRDYLATIHRDVLAPIGGMFDGRLKVAGSWWQGGVGVNDCVRKAKETAVSVYEGWDECTGLEEYLGDEKWCLRRRKTGEVRPDLMSINR